MRFLAKFFSVILLFLSVAVARADVEVVLPDTSAFSGDTLRVPVRVSDLTGLEIYSYQFDLHYDASVVQALGVDSTGTLTQAWGGAVLNLESSGLMRVGNYSTSALAGEGVLIFLKFALIGTGHDSTQLDIQNFEFNDVNPPAIITDGSIKILPPPISVSFELNMSADLEFFIDGHRKTFPFDTVWSAGSEHILSTTSPQNVSEDTRYTFLSWSDGGDLSHTIAPTQDATFTLNMGKEYSLTLNSDHGDPQGEGWYAETSQATFTVDSLVMAGDSTRFIFSGWTGEGAAAYTGSQRTNTIVMNSPVIETAQWKAQHYVEIESVFGTPVGQGWHDMGATVEISIDSVISFVEGTRYVFDNWMGTGAGSYTGADRLASIVVSNPIKQTANWGTEFYFDLTCNPVGLANFSESGWFAKNAIATGDTAQTLIQTTDRAYRFQFWELDGEQVVMNPVSVVMDTSHSAEAVYEIDSVRVNISSEIMDNIFISVDEKKQSLPYQNFWAYQSEHIVGVDSTQFSSDSTIRYSFELWTSGAARIHTLKADDVVQLTVNFTTEFYLSVDTYPAGLVEFSEAGWHQPGSSVQLPAAEPFVVAEPDTFFFKGWQVDGLPLTGNPISVTMDEPHEVVAIYEDLYSIAGYVNNTQGQSLEDVKLILSGAKNDTAVTGVSGEFYFNYLVAGEYRITPHLDGFSFEPQFREYGELNQIQLDQNFTAIDVEDPVVQLLSPNGGEQFQGASVDTILWTANDNVGIDSVTIEFTDNNGSTWENIAELKSPQHDFYVWNVPDLSSTNCKILVRVFDLDGNEAVDQSDSPFTIIGNSSVEESPASTLPAEFCVEQNYPNPFNSATIIPFHLPQKSRVTIRIFNLVGQEIYLLVDQDFPAGSFQISWDGEDARGLEMSSGIYFYRVEAMSQVFTRRLVYLR